jgi:glutamate N-acetyltransferase/amino-acid N-acetyltransferase
MAIGKSQEDVAINKLKIKIGDFSVVEKGIRSKDYDENKIKEYMEWDSIDINVELDMGEASHTVYTCDFTKDYIDINTDYRN